MKYLKGDKVRIYKEVEIGKDQDEHGWVYDTKGHIYHVDQGFWDIELLDRPEKRPAHWPPKAGDVWRTRSAEYMILADIVRKEGITIRDSSDMVNHHITLSQLKDMNPVLAYRKGRI